MPKRRQIITAGGMPGISITPPVVVTAAGETIVHKDADTVGAHEITGGVRKIVEKAGGAYVEDGLDQETGVQDVTDTIVTGQTEAAPTRQEGLTSVTAHEVSGEIANSATDNGALQSPGLPVKVTSGKLGPSAAYNAVNWLANMYSGVADVYMGDISTGNDNWTNPSNLGYNASIGNYVLLIGTSGGGGTLVVNSETNVTRKVLEYATSSGGYPFIFGLWTLNTTGGLNAGDINLEASSGVAGTYDHAFLVLTSLTEFG